MPMYERYTRQSSSIFCTGQGRSPCVNSAAERSARSGAARGTVFHGAKVHALAEHCSCTRSNAHALAKRRRREAHLIIPTYGLRRLVDGELKFPQVEVVLDLEELVVVAHGAPVERKRRVRAGRCAWCRSCALRATRPPLTQTEGSGQATHPDV